MFRAILISLSIFIMAAAWGDISILYPKGTPSLSKEKKALFSHGKHRKTFDDLQVGCTDCHNFAIKSLQQGPLGTQVKRGYLKAPKGICHECHIRKRGHTSLSNCLLCHANKMELKPADHHQGWKKFHGRKASHDEDSCYQCHARSSCSECHTKRDIMNPKVHPGNFRMFHSIEARSKPSSCIQCHQSRRFCSDCHEGRRR
jgi:hypothetical protein